MNTYLDANRRVFLETLEVTHQALTGTCTHLSLKVSFLLTALDRNWNEETQEYRRVGGMDVKSLEEESSLTASIQEVYGLEDQNGR